MASSSSPLAQFWRCHVFFPSIFALLLCGGLFIRLRIEEHDVLISFGGEQIYYNFVSHLKSKLEKKSIEVFVDRRPEEVAPHASSRSRVIEHSKVVLIVFSEDYPYCISCADELVEVIEFHAPRNTAIPIFYGIDPEDVAEQNRHFDQAFLEHEKTYSGSRQLHQVQRWRAAAKTAGNIAGCPSREYNLQADFVKDVVERVRIRVAGETKRQASMDRDGRRLTALLLLLFWVLMYNISYFVHISTQEYDVFVNYNGEVTLVSKLYDALEKKKGITTFKRRGFAKGNHLIWRDRKAIQKSKLAVIIFSEGYAYSESCLDELVKIMESYDSRRLVAVCFLVTEQDVSEQKGSFQEAFKMHEKRGNKNAKRWKQAIVEAAEKVGDEDLKKHKVVDKDSKKNSSEEGSKMVDSDAEDISYKGFKVVRSVADDIEKKLKELPSTSLEDKSNYYWPWVVFSSFLGSMLILSLLSDRGKLELLVGFLRTYLQEALFYGLESLCVRGTRMQEIFMDFLRKELPGIWHFVFRISTSLIVSVFDSSPWLASYHYLDETF